MNYDELKSSLRSSVMERLDMSRELNDKEVEAVIDDCIFMCEKSKCLSLKVKLRVLYSRRAQPRVSKPTPRLAVVAGTRTVTFSMMLQPPFQSHSFPSPRA